jgi:hypothetical protein
MHMQFEPLSPWRGIEEQDLARIPVEAKPDSTRESEIVKAAEIDRTLFDSSGVGFLRAVFFDLVDLVLVFFSGGHWRSLASS